MGFDTVLSTTYSSNMSSKRVTDSFKLNVVKKWTKISKTQEWNKRMIHISMKSKMKRLSSKKANFSIHQNIMLFRKQEQGINIIVSATLVQRFTMATLRWKVHNFLNFKALLLNLYTFNSPVSGYLRCREFFPLIRSVHFLQSWHFCHFWSNKDPWLLFIKKASEALAGRSL